MPDVKGNEPPEFGDRGWVGVKMQYEPQEVPPHYVSDAQNMRFNKGVAEPRKGCVWLPYMNKVTAGVMGSWGTIFGWGRFRDPQTQRDYELIAADGGVFFTTFGNAAVAVTLPTGESVTEPCRFVQCFDVVLCLRGTAKAPLVMTSILQGFKAVVQTDQGDGTLTLANADRGLNSGNRLYVIQGDTVLASDELDYTRYTLLDQFRINEGSEDSLVQIGMFGRTTMIALKEKSVYELDNVQGDLSSVVLSPVTRRYGCVAPLSAMDLGKDFVWLSQEGVASLTLTALNEVQTAQGLYKGGGTWPMFSDDILPLIKRINWQYAAGACAGFWEGKYYLAVPLDDAELLGPELMPQGAQWGSTVSLPLTPGTRYRFTIGTNGENLLDSLGHSYAGGDFIAADVEAFYNQTAPGTIDASLRQVTKGVNNAVLVYDTLAGPTGAWAGYDQADGMDVAEFLLGPYLGRQRLFFRTSAGYIGLYEEDYEDQLVAPYADVNVNVMPANGNTLRVNGGTVVTADTGQVGNAGTHWGLSGTTLATARAALWLDAGQVPGYFQVPAGAWTAPGTNPVPSALGVRFYATNGQVPSVTATGNWAGIFQTTTQPVAARLLTRAYGEDDLGLQRFQWLYLDLELWNAQFDVNLVSPAAFGTKALAAGKTKDPTLYYRPWDKAPYVLSNVNGDFATEARQDYSIVPTAGGFSLFPVAFSFFPSAGVSGTIHQASREPFHFQMRQRSAQVEIKCNRGRMRVVALKMTTQELSERGVTVN